MDVVAPVGPGLPGGHAVGEPARRRRRASPRSSGSTSAPTSTLEELGRALEDELARAVRRTGVTARVQRVGSAFTLFFTSEEVVDLASAKKSRHRALRQVLPRHAGARVHAPPAQFEAAFISLAHTVEDIEGFSAAAKEVLGETHRHSGQVG